MSVRVTASRLSALERYRPADDPDIAEAKRDHAAARIEAAIRRNLDAAPPLTTEQCATLTVMLFRGGQR